MAQKIDARIMRGVTILLVKPAQLAVAVATERVVPALVTRIVDEGSHSRGALGREKWLQGMQSNDLAAAAYGGAVAGLFLGGKGRLVASGLLWRRPDEVIVTTDRERFDALKAHLDKLLIMEDCELEDVEGLRRLRWWPSSSAPRAPEHITGSWQPLGLELLLPEAEAQSLLESRRERPRPDQD